MYSPMAIPIQRCIWNAIFRISTLRGWRRQRVRNVIVGWILTFEGCFGGPRRPEAPPSGYRPPTG